MKKIFLAVLLVFLNGAAGTLHANFIFTLSQVGPNVVVNGAGTLNFSALTLAGSGSFGSGIQPNGAAIVVGGPTTEYSGLTGPAAWGAGSVTLASSSSGDVVGVIGNIGRLIVPTGYMSGNALSDTMTFSGATFASLGFTPGTYIYTWGSGATADSLTVTTAVPEGGASALLLGTSVAGLFATHRRTSVRRHRSV